MDGKLSNLQQNITELFKAIDILNQKPYEGEVIFNAYRHNNMSSPGTITYSGTNVNLGNGLNSATGIFTAPRSGFYFFQFQALSDDGEANFITIKHNGEAVSSYESYEDTVKPI